MINFFIFAFPTVLFIFLWFFFTRKPHTRKFPYVFCMLLPNLAFLPSLFQNPRIIFPLTLPDGGVLISPHIMGFLNLFAIISAYLLTIPKQKSQ